MINPLYIIGAIVAAALMGYVKGCSDESEHFESYKLTVQAIGQAQEERTKARIAQQKLNKEVADAKHDEMVENLHRRVDTLVAGMRRLTAGSSVVPDSPRTAEGGDGNTLCLARDELDRRVGTALERLLDRTAGVLQRGEEARIAFQTCAQWALKNADLSR